MNIDRLKAAETEFFSRYPGGFINPEMVAVGKKHKVEKMHEMALEFFEKDRFVMVDELIQNTIKLVSRASLVSVFEKPKFKDCMNGLRDDEKHLFAEGLFQLIHGNQALGFEQMIEVLVPAKLAKWSLMTICMYYYAPTEEVFIKPTTAKNVIKYFELEGLTYKPRPSFEFYQAYKEQIKKMASLVDASLSPDYGAFGGFLMLTMK